MVTDCFGARVWDLSDAETIFVQGVYGLLKILILVGTLMYTWNVCRTDQPHSRTSVLGLDEPPSGK